MNDQCRYLFIYGTLLHKQNVFASYLKENSTFFAKGKLRGLLYDIGSYPGVLLNPSGDTFVYGSIVYMNNPVTVLEKLDYYEGIGDLYPEPHEYVRALVDIETEKGIINCWVYLYNWPFDEHRQIVSGDYMAYIKN